MTTTDHEALARRVAKIQEHVRKAHRALDDGEAEVVGFQARRAVEEMLVAWCLLRGLETGRGRGEGQFETLKQRLVHAHVLHGRLARHVGHVQQLGNDAVHADTGHGQVESFSLDDARSVVPSLDAVWNAFRAALPRDVAREAHVRRGLRALGWVGTGTAALGVALVLGVALRSGCAAPPQDRTPIAPGFRVGEGLPPTLATAEVVPVAPVAAAAQRRDAAAAEDGPAEVPHPETTPARSVTDEAPRPRVGPSVAAPTTPRPAPRPALAVKEGRLLATEDLADVDCEHLKWARDWLWARHGYRFTSDEGKAHFEPIEAYVPRVGLRSAQEMFTANDWSNLKTISGTMARRQCDCPRAGRAALPCPE